MAALPEHDAAVVAVAAFPVVFWFHVGTVPVRPEYATLVAVAALPVTLMLQVPDAPVPVGDGTSVPMVNPKLVLAAEAEVALVPPLAIAKVPVMSAVLRLMASQLELVPSVWRYLLALLVWLGSSAFKAALAEVCPVPPLAMAKVPVRFAASMV